MGQLVRLVSYAVVMPVVLVRSGEHYAVDTVLGAGYAVAVRVVAPRLGGLLRRRRAAVAEVVPEGGRAG